MQLQPITPDPKRDAAAALLAEQAGSWPIVTLTRPFGAFAIGSRFYSVPSRSRPNARYLANAVACQCPDYDPERGGHMCAHVRAVRLHEAARQQQTGSAIEADPTRSDSRFFDSPDDICSVKRCSAWATISGGTCREHGTMTFHALVLNPLVEA